jgi:demethylmenaquinone methyltransferase / 2-methoxy-6-polyprenyl-1,4-benzoquinol methylase
MNPVRQMFDRIAPRYDLANRVMSAGIDKLWRKRAAAALAPLDGERILDLACGTGDCAKEISRLAPGAHVVGMDFAREMLRRNTFSIAQADAMALPIASESLDGAICAFGFRNVPDALGEVRRVLRPGGRLVVVEFFRGKHVAHSLARKIGGLVSGDREAYEYLAESIGRYVSAEEFVGQLERLGFTNVTARPLFPSGVAHLIKGVRS